MKFNHRFILKDNGKNYRLYKSDNINARIDFISDTAVRVAIFRDDADLLPTFCINPTNDLSVLGRKRLDTDGFEMSEPEICSRDSEDVFILKNGIKITLNLNNFLLSYYMGKNLLLADRAPLAYNFENEFGTGSIHYLSRENGEHIFGLGDKCGKLDKAGRSYRIETSDSMGYDASSTDPLYKHIPFYICEITRAYYNEAADMEAEKKYSLFFDDFSIEEYEKYKNSRILNQKLSVQEKKETIVIKNEIKCIDFMGVKQKIEFDTQNQQNNLHKKAENLFTN